MTKQQTTSDLSRVKRIRNLRQAYDFLGLSWRRLAAQLPKPNGRGHYSHSELIAWADGARVMPGDQIMRVGQLIVNRLAAHYNRDDIAIHLVHNSPWKITPLYRCQRCGRRHELKRANQRKCK